jgi:hypothetical protein
MSVHGDTPMPSGAKRPASDAAMSAPYSLRINGFSNNPAWLVPRQYIVLETTDIAFASVLFALRVS